MFTGIVEGVAKVTQIKDDGTNKQFVFTSVISNELKIDQSLSHNGVCLTVTQAGNNTHEVTAVKETLLKSNLGLLNIGDVVNLERCMVANGRFDGHIVQGHVDQVGTVLDVEDQNGSWLFTFRYDSSLGNVTVEKGSIAVNGVSLTCFNSREGEFSVAIIPYTYEHTNFKTLKKGDTVNLEFDIIGKYVKRIMAH